MYEFTYHKPASLDEIANLLGANEEAKLVAGGMTLVPTLKQRLAKPSDLVDLAAIASLRGITDAGDAIVIGAMTRHGEVQPFAGRQARDPGFGGDGRDDRRPGGAQPRHDRRLDLRTTTRRRIIRPHSWRSARPCTRPSARSRPRVSLPACSRPHSNRPRS